MNKMRLDRLPYQHDAINACVAYIGGECPRENANSFANPLLRNAKNIDVKMETGTGKTYVYTRLMHELKREFGFFKFIIIVPSLAIKEGVKMSIENADWKAHFRAEYNNQYIQFGAVNAGDFETKKGGRRRLIPEALRSFCEGDAREEKAVFALLLNDAMLGSVSMTRSDYDTSLFGGISCPIKGLSACRPIVIIDEPHRFNKENKAWKTIAELLKPQFIIRFGATFPDITTVVDKKKKITKKDYEGGRPVYELNSIRAFNDGIVKGVSIMYPAVPELKGDLVKFKVKKLDKIGKKAVFNDGKKEYELNIGESLSNLNTGFGNITLDILVEKDKIKSFTLSNEQELAEGMYLFPQTFAMSYQELMLSQALDAHFEKEKKNFDRQKGNKIKTNSLFFIDSVASFRGDTENEKGWLRAEFEKLLKKKLQVEIAAAQGEYLEFLAYSLQNINACIAGYFAEDNAKSDEAIQNEVDKVLRDKESSLTFKNKNGNWNVCRFFFSKWTLCEGWDNPNVFVICKLRSSGSENRKLQEVGRGLRLPFDENGRRISDEEFYLTYIIDYSEKDFAQKLVGEINADGDGLGAGKITEAILETLVKNKYAKNITLAFARLLTEEIVGVNKNILDIEKLCAVLPEDSGLKVKAGKIIGADLPGRPKIKLNKENFEQIRELWDKVTRRYFLCFEKAGAAELKKALSEILTAEDIFVQSNTRLIEERLTKGENEVRIAQPSYQFVKSGLGEIPYGEFLKRLNRQTNLPVKLLHESIIAARNGEETPRELFNTVTLKNIISAFEKKFEEIFSQKFSYQPLDFTARTSIFTENGGFIEELAQGDVGGKVADDIQRGKDNYLYDKYAYDSEIEYEILKVEPPSQVTVYGKLPRRSIKLPTYVGGTTTPDFVYAISKAGETKLYFIVEAKSDDMRSSEEAAIESQKKAFEKISSASGGVPIIYAMETDVAKFAGRLMELVNVG
jgi:type III restriction enzyme